MPRSAFDAGHSWFKQLFELSPDPAWIIDGNKFVECNEAAIKTLGYASRDTLLNVHPSKLSPPRQPDGEDSYIKAEHMMALAKDKGLHRFEWVHTKADGVNFAAEVTLSVIKFPDRKVIYCVWRDISERKRVEAQLRESQKMEALGTLAGGVAHDFNNVLATILGNVELARQDMGPGHKAAESLEEIDKAGRRARKLVQQILTFGRRQATERKVISLIPVVEEAAKLLRATLPAEIYMNVVCAADAPMVLADATQIEQVLLNLCNNSWHATKEREGDAAIGIRLYAGMRGGLRCTVLKVRDNGHGMDEATLSRIFEPFFTTKPVDKGTGLGLSVVHGIVKEHGADIEVTSTVGEGTTFLIRFPEAQAPEQHVPERTPQAVSVHGQGKHILYVDDDESIVLLMTRLLERKGFRVSGYTNPFDALAAARADSGQFDLAVTDYSMPGASGLEVVRTLKAIRADLPVVMASGYITDELRQNAPAAGVSELIYKPNTVDDLCDAVARYASAQAADGKSKPS